MYDDIVCWIFLCLGWLNDACTDVHMIFVCSPYFVVK
jgi:hypothetical protein